MIERAGHYYSYYKYKYKYNYRTYIRAIGNHNILVGVKSDRACGPLLQLLPLTCLPSARPPTYTCSEISKNISKGFQMFTKHLKNGRQYFKRYNKLAFVDTFQGNHAKLHVHVLQDFFFIQKLVVFGHSARREATSTPTKTFS